MCVVSSYSKGAHLAQNSTLSKGGPIAPLIPTLNCTTYIIMYMTYLISDIYRYIRF